MATDDSLSAGHCRSDHLVPTKPLQSTPTAAQLSATGAGNGQETLEKMGYGTQAAASQAFDATQHCALQPQPQPHLPFGSMFTLQDSSADFTAFAQGTQAPVSGPLYSQESDVAACFAFPDNTSSAFAVQTGTSGRRPLCPPGHVAAPDFLGVSSLSLSSAPAPTASSSSSSGAGNQALSINAMSQMTENELLWVINPATFEPCT